jgi:hypothetical protein
LPQEKKNHRLFQSNKRKSNNKNVTLEVEAFLLEAAYDLADLSENKVKLAPSAQTPNKIDGRENRIRRGTYEAPLDAIGLDHDEGLLHCCWRGAACSFALLGFRDLVGAAVGTLGEGFFADIYGPGTGRPFAQHRHVSVSPGVSIVATGPAHQMQNGSSANGMSSGLHLVTAAFYGIGDLKAPFGDGMPAIWTKFKNVSNSFFFKTVPSF